MKKIFCLILLLIIFSALSAKSEWTGKDKVLHFTGSAFLTYWNYGLSKDIMGNSHTKSKYYAVSVSFALGSTKEYSDKKLKTTGFSWYDLAYDTAGIIAGLVLINNLR